MSESKDQQIARLRMELVKARETSVREFVKAILHGDMGHRRWLLDAAERFIRGEPPLLFTDLKEPGQ